MVTAESGFMQQTRILAISTQRLVLSGYYVLPLNAQCRLEVLIPPLKVEDGLKVSEMQGRVESVIFSGEIIRLIFKLNSVPPEVKHQIERYGMDVIYHRQEARYSLV